MKETPFAQLALLGEELERTTSRLELARLIADFLRGLSREEIAPAVRLTIGQIFSPWDGRTLNLSWAAVSKAMGELTQASEEGRRAIAAEAVDGGEAVKLLLERARKRPPREPPLTLLEVYQTFEQIAETSGRGSRARKEGLLRSLWEAIHEAAAGENLLISHQHGAPELRAAALERELGAGGLRLLAALEQCLDPGDLMNPGRILPRPLGQGHPPTGGASPEG